MFGYQSINHLEVAKNHFNRVEREMRDYYGLNTDYEISFNGWELTIQSDNEHCIIDLSECCKWQFVIDEGLSFQYNDERMILWFNKSIFGDEQLCFIGIHQLR